jgi:hypothetical protein
VLACLCVGFLFACGQWAEEQGFLFAVASAKLSEGVFDAFSGLAQACSSNLLGRAVSGSDRQVKQTPTASVLRVNLSELENPNAFVATGEPLRCAGCGCFFSVLSQLSQAPNKIQKSKIEMAPPIHAALGQPAPPKKARAWWNCEMCDFANGVDASDEELAEMQVSSTIDFLVRSPLQGGCVCLGKFFFFFFFHLERFSCGNSAKRSNLCD